MTGESIFDAIVGLCTFGALHIGAFMFLDLLTDRAEQPAQNVELPVARVNWKDFSGKN